MKKYLIFFVAMTLVLCMTLPLVSCMANIPSETTSSSESEKTDVTVTTEPDKDRSEASETSEDDLLEDSTMPEADTDESRSTETDSCEPDTDMVDSTEAAAVTTESETEDNNTHETDTYVPMVELPTGDGYTWKDAVTNISSNWNPHTYQTSSEKYPLQYITAGLYAFYYNDEVNYKTENGLDPFTGYVTVPEMASEMPVDITEQVKGEHPEFMIPDGATEGYAYKIALNPNATWENGEKINADTYIYSMMQLLGPELNNYRAYDHFWIANAEEYLRQGTNKYVDNGISAKYALADLIKGEDGNYYTKDGNAMLIAVHYPLDWLGNNTLKHYVDAYGDSYFGLERWDSLVKAMDDNGMAPLNDETYAALLATVTANANWGETEEDAFNYFVERIVYEDNYDFSNVGLYKTGEYEIVIVLDAPIEDFELINKLTENWIVYMPYYEAAKFNGGSYYCSKYGYTMSYGPYKLVKYESGWYMTFEKNENWYGYTDGKHIYVDPDDGKTYDMYQTTRIECLAISEPEYQKQAFLCGYSMSYTLKSSDFAEYRSSDRAYFTPSGTVFFMLLNGRTEIIQEREAHETFDTAQYDIESLTLKSFRQAMALTFDTEAFAAEVTPSRRGGYGLIGSAYIYNTETGEKYRDTDEAKRVLCEFYGVDVSAFESVDAAFDSIKVYDYEKAKALFTEAFYEALSAGYITDSNGDGISDQTIKLEYISSATSDFMKRTLAFLNSELVKATEGTPFEGKIEIKESVPYGSSWVWPIKGGTIDVVLAGWGGDLFDPYSLTENYTDPKKQYDEKWFDSSAVSLTLNIEGNEITMSLREWSQALNGTTIEFTEGCEIFSYNFADADAEIKLQILAAIEREILSNYYYIPMLQDGSVSLLSHQVNFVTDEYNPIMDRGGLAYARYNYNDSEWAEYVYSFKGNIPY